MMIESISSLIAENSAFNIFLSALILEIVRKGLKTRRERNPLRLIPELVLRKYGRYAVETITKSRMFHASRRYAP